MINLELSDQILEQVDLAESNFNDCFGFRAKPGIDGTTFPNYHQLKYFGMPKALRVLVKEACSDFDKNVETYFLRFGLDGHIPPSKAVDSCFFVCKAVLLRGSAIVQYENEIYNLEAGDTIDIEPRYVSAVSPREECVFMIEMQMVESN